MLHGETQSQTSPPPLKKRLLLVAEGGPTLFFQFQIRALESQKRQQEIVLRRKTQEVRALNRQPGCTGLALVLMFALL